MNYPMQRIFLIVLFCLIVPVTAHAGQNWEGTDDMVDRKMTELAGVSAREPLIDISQGNLGLFLFAAGGFGAGAVAGYQWRKLFLERAGSKDD